MEAWCGSASLAWWTAAYCMCCRRYVPNVVSSLAMMETWKSRGFFRYDVLALLEYRYDYAFIFEFTSSTRFASARTHHDGE
jgi:hypothetical protein